MGKPTVGWFEITGKDAAALQRFYSHLFGWDITDAGDGSGYGLVAAEEGGISGGIGASPDGGHGGVTVYVEVDDPAQLLEKAGKLGGWTVVPPSEIPDAFSFFAYPEGHVLGLSHRAVR